MSNDILGDDFAIDRAVEAAQKAAKDYLEKHGDGYPCGFAWAVVKPNRGKLAQRLCERGLARPHHNGGLQVYNPSGNHTQNMDAKEAGARAWVDVMKAAYPDYKIWMESRMD